jgi:sortase A
MDLNATAKRPRKTLPRLLEGAAYVGGVLLLVVALGSVLRSEVRAAQATEALPNMQLWSNEAKARYLAALDEADAPVLGVLHAPSLALEVPVYDSDSELNMDRGAGIIDGMAYPHELGHIGIAGHRDGYFRALKDLQLGDRLVLETLHGTKEFIVDDLRVIEPTELDYLQETVDQRLTIVTCYPFYFAGSAPQRYLVRATPSSAEARFGISHSGVLP